MLAMAEQGYAPRFMAYVDKAGRPLWALASVLVFFPLAYINVADVGTTVFDWLIAVSGLATIFTWLSINVAHIRFRLAWKAQGHSVDELPFQALGGIWGSFLGATILVLVLIAQVYIAIWPLGGVANGAERAESFFMAYRELFSGVSWSCIIRSLTFSYNSGSTYRSSLLYCRPYLASAQAEEACRD